LRIVVGGGSLWVMWSGRQTQIERIDPDTLTTIDTVTTELVFPSLAWGEGSLWAAGRILSGEDDEVHVVRIAPDGSIQAQIVVSDLPGGAFGPEGRIAVGFGGVWLADDYGSEVVRIDPATNTEVVRIRVAPNPGSFSSALQIASGRVWLRSVDTVYAIDPMSNEAEPWAELPTRETLGLVTSLVGTIVFMPEDG